MTERGLKWTDQQRRAISARGTDVLVTASAGTGKTAVLSGRFVDMVSDESAHADVTGTLVLTFTEAAAEQMRSRIAGQLKDAFLKSGDAHIRRQLILLQGADISTIHSFCKRLITQYFYELGLDPTFSVIDADEAELLKGEVLEQTVDWGWAQSNLAAALEQLLRRRDLRTRDGFLAMVKELSDFLDCVIRREQWYEKAARLAEVADPFVSGLGRRQERMIAARLRDIIEQLSHAGRLCEDQTAGGDWRAWFEEAFVEPVARCLGLLESDRWDQCVSAIREFRRPRFRRPKEVSEDIVELVRRIVGKAFEDFRAVSGLAILNPAYLDKISGSVSLQTKVLVELVKKFDRLYGRAKRAINSLDFADLEHYALQLLTDEADWGDSVIPSRTALALRQRYKYIFVDEYQDINPVQQAILDALSTGGNVFVVGDVKQSIYAWRGAEPRIFLERLKPASTHPAEALNGLRVDLNANFRSAAGILDFVNKLFGRIMRSGGPVGIEYDDSARLRPALADGYKGRPECDQAGIVRLHILDEKGKMEDEHEDPNGGRLDEAGLDIVSPRQRQAAMIARDIRRMVGADGGEPEFQIFDKEQGCLRDVRYGDIVILMRSLAKKANDYVEVLRLAGVPVSCEATAGYFEATEISDMVCLLKVLDNPQRDIELAAVLRSPLFGVTDTELAKMMIHCGNEQERGNYYDRALLYCRSAADAELAGRLQGILTDLDDWRTVARRGNLADLIWQIYRKTRYLSFVSALPNGRSRCANLLKLHDRAIQFEGFASSAGNPSLGRFVEFIEKLREAGQDWAPAEPEAAVGDAVRILSVHKSKGLEFPVVFLAELESRFNKRDVHADCLADTEDALGLRIIDPESNSKLRSLAHEVIAERKLATALAEEMRILYVATTRARDRLILTASQKHADCREIITNGFFFGDEGIPDWQLRACRSPLEWVLYGLSDQRSLHEAFGTALEHGASDRGLFGLELHERQRLRELSEFVVRLKSNKARRAARRRKTVTPKRVGSELLSKVKESIDRTYRFGEAPSRPAKSSVTQLTHRDDEYVRFDYSKALERRPRSLSAEGSDAGGSAEPKLIGSATHLVICQLDLGRQVTPEAVERTKRRLVSGGAISRTVAERVDTESIAAFFASEPGRLVLNCENTVWREWPFTFALPDSEYRDNRLAAISEGGTPETIVVQGIIDMLIRTRHGLVVVDFKTDNISPGQIVRRAELYRGQLELYSRAASAILKRETLAMWLYFLTPRRAFEVTH